MYSSFCCSFILWHFYLMKCIVNKSTKKIEVEFWVFVLKREPF